MRVELAPVTQRPKFESTPFQFDIPIADYALSLEGLGIIQGTYVSDFIRGKRDGTYGVFVWNILTPQSVEEGLSPLVTKQVKNYARLLRDEVDGFGLPVKVHTVFVRPEREQALKNHLDRNNINYSY